MEEKLIQECIGRDPRALNDLFTQYAPRMLMVCSRYMSDRDDAKDILQRGFIKVFENLEKFKRQGSFEGWIRRIMVNEALNELKKRSRIQYCNDTILQTLSTEENESLKESEFEPSELLRVLNALPPDFRSVFNLHCFEELSHKQIAEELNIKVETSRSRLKRARILLKEQLLQLRQLKIHRI